MCRAGLATKPNKPWRRAPQFWGPQYVDEKVFVSLMMLNKMAIASRLYAVGRRNVYGDSTECG